MNMPEVLRHRVPSLNINLLYHCYRMPQKSLPRQNYYIGLQKLDVIGISAYQRKVNKLKGGIGK